jgi:polysaccharide export outer membrane protein
MMSSHGEQIRSRRGRALGPSAAAWLAGLGLLVALGCSSTAKNADVVIKNSQDVAKLEELQKGLEINEGKAADNPRIKVVDGVAVENLPEYRIGAGDILEVVYQIQYDRNNETYRLQVLDRVNVMFPFQPQFNSSAVVRSDGRISLPLVGDIMAESLTTQELTEILTKLYSKYIIKPNVSVSMEESNVKIDELKKAITTAPRGQSKISPVAPDGRAGFPLVGAVQASGLTVSQLEKSLNEKYKAKVKNLEVTLILNEIHNAKCFVLGEVDKPGVYEMPGREPLLAVLAQAGSTKDTANLGDVLIFRNDGVERPMTIKVDLSKATDRALAATNIYVHPADIIYVPKGSIDDINVAINKIFTKGLYSILPFGSSFSATYDFTKYSTGGATSVISSP